MGEPSTSVSVPAASSLAAGRVLTTKSTPRAIGFSLLTLASIPLSILAAFVLSPGTLVVPFLVGFLSARKTAALVFPAITVTLPPGPLSRTSTIELTVAVGPGPDVYHRLVLEASVDEPASGDDDLGSCHAWPILDTNDAAPGSLHVVEVSLGSLLRTPRASASFSVRGYVRWLPDATIDAFRLPIA